MKEIRIAPSFIALTTSSEGACTPRTTSASLTRACRSDVNATSLNAASTRPTASPAPDCMCSLSPSLVILLTTDGTNATRRSCGCVSFRTATLTYMGSFLAGRCRGRRYPSSRPTRRSGGLKRLIPLVRPDVSDWRLGNQGADQLLVHKFLDAHVA